jgi:DNA-directed RNA polymerase subunit M/transcription elongation factor TFIIS
MQILSFRRQVKRLKEEKFLGTRVTMSGPKKTGSKAISFGSIAPRGGAAAAPILGIRLTQAGSKRVNQARSAEVDELGRIMSQLFTIPEQAEEISALRSGKPPDDKPFFTLQNKARLLDVRSLIRHTDFATTLEFLKKLPDADVIITESPLLLATRQQHQLEDELIERREDVTEGEYTCGKCTSRRIGRRLKQTRSADEPMSVFLRCTACSNRWRE